MTAHLCLQDWTAAMTGMRIWDVEQKIWFKVINKAFFLTFFFKALIQTVILHIHCHFWLVLLHVLGGKICQNKRQLMPQLKHEF